MTKIFGWALFKAGYSRGPINNLARVEVVENSKIYSINKYRDYVFVGTANNFYILDRNGKLLRIVELRKVTCTFFEGDQMWVGTQQLGLWKFDISDIFNPIQNSRYNIYGSHNKIESDRITTITKDYSGNLWIGTYNGLHKFDDETKRFVNQSEFFSGQMPKITNTLYVDNHFIWVGTPSGLYQLKYENDTLEIVKSFNDSNYLKNDFICGITKNNDNVMWLSTSNSIVKYNPNDQSFTHYGKNDGVGTSQFNLRSFYNFDHELILAGGVDNLTYFNPSEISDASIKSEIIITQFNVDNIDIVPGDSINGRILLNNAINYTDKITLTHKEKSLYLSFIKNNFRNDIKSNYRYRLIGHEEEWVDLNEKSELNFMGLGPGNYELQLSASDDGKNWVKPKILGVEVLYAPWLSPLAYSFYIVMLLLIIGTVIFLVMRELHERNKLKKEQELSESKFTFFTNISHEFRTPLTLILSPLKELNKSTQFDSKTTEKLYTMEKNANRLLDLINQLLDFRKADHGLLKLDVKPGNFVNFSKEVFLYFKELSATKQINYSFGAMQEEIIFPFDRNKMEIVICNLISNSLKFSAPGAKVKLKVSGTKSACIMVLEDTGQGMDRESKNRIFDRFYQINSTNTSDIIGSGLGLSFTKKIVELHDGTIDVESKVNKGTVFTLSFPITSGSRNPEYKPKRIEIETTSLFPKSNIDIEVPSNTLKVNARENTILIVDDNLEIRNYLNQLLNEDYNVISARDGVEAIEIASEEIPDLILCDIMMPRKDGLAVCKELKEQLNTSHIPILLLTARSANLFEIKSLDTGADDFITKPFDPDIVKARISSALKNRLKLREHFLNKVRFEPSVSNSQNKDSETLFIERLVQLVEENLMNDQFGIESIMAILHMSQSTLYRKIKSLTGLSLTAFIRSIRIKKAAEIILTENEKLKTVSLLVGFNDYKHFSESFKKQFGCLPSEYKSVKKDNSL
jgi:signal transduction histidine kinase/DNA-binding response OmpR family regulator